MPADKLFLDSEPEAKPATAAGGLPLTGSERNATMDATDGEPEKLFLSSSPSAPTVQHFFQVLSRVTVDIS